MNEMKFIKEINILIFVENYENSFAHKIQKSHFRS